jgi:general secretion pathway protein G
MITQSARLPFRSRGFTLIEIMVVVVIIGLLAAIVAPSVVGNIDKAAITRAKQDIRSIEVALNQFYLSNFRYPDEDDEGLEILVGRPAGVNDAAFQQYLARLPVDPWDQAYRYDSPGENGRQFDVYTYGKDDEEGGEGINADIGSWDLN